jgi:LysM repeat protein
MKILKIFGFVVGIHLFALILIFANPGCSSTAKPQPAPSDTMIRAEPPPAVSLPSGATTVVLPGGDALAGAGAPSTFNPEAPAGAAGPVVRFTPTRPGTPVASTLVAEPVADVTPAATYTVAGGDNLWTLSKKFHISTAEIAAANRIKTNAILRPGQKLIIPGKPVAIKEPATASPAPAPARTADVAAPKPSADAVKHVVKAGETLSMISQQYGVKQGEIAVANNISDPQKIRAGMELTIPGWKALASKSGKSASKSAPGAAAKAAPAKAADPKLIFSLEPEPASVPKPSSGAEVPVIRVDDSPIAPAPKNP